VHEKKMYFIVKQDYSKMQVLWLYKQRIQWKLQEITECSRIFVEWRNIKIIISQAANEILGKYKVFIQTNKLKIRDD
jgi:hypothetical protein